jgi:hypothetical protein
MNGMFWRDNRMDLNNGVSQVCDAVEHAQIAVYRAQSYNCPQEFQHAQQLVAYAQQVLRDSAGVNFNEEEQLRVKHARELLRHLQETQASLQQ